MGRTLLSGRWCPISPTWGCGCRTGSPRPPRPTARFIGDTGLAETISSRLAGLDTDDVQELARAGKEIRDAVVTQPFPLDLEADIRIGVRASGRSRW